jgi:NAD-dependent deacetylase
MNALSRMIEESPRTAVFTGAGVSTLCGIPDFRGPEGLYRKMDGDRIFSLDEFDRDPSFYYRHAADFIYGMGEVAPGIVHTVCAELGRRGLVAGVVTQNIDMLHQKAGSPAVIEVHGSPITHTCRGCRARVSFEDVLPAARAGRVPYCEACGGVMKPDITFFGEMLPEGALEAAFELAASADLMLVLGSSLVVQPAASVPLATARAGGRLAVVNRDPTPLDDLAAYRGEDLAREFAALAAHFGVN